MTRAAASILILPILCAFGQPIQHNGIANDTRHPGESVQDIQGQQAAIPEIDVLHQSTPTMTGLEPAFEPLDIPLDPALQEYTSTLCREAGISPDILFSIMEHESGFNPDAVGYNTNGTTDVGLCQINSCNWVWLAAEGIDVHDPRGNIQAAVRILAKHHDTYPLDQALAAYAAGEAGMLRGGGARFAYEIIEASPIGAAS